MEHERMKLSLGPDFGTESLRALLVALDTGQEVGEEAFEYPHGVMDERLPCGHTAQTRLVP
jgi:L-ribulokinase